MLIVFALMCDVKDHTTTQGDVIGD